MTVIDGDVCLGDDLQSGTLRNTHKVYRGRRVYEGDRSIVKINWVYVW